MCNTLDSDEFKANLMNTADSHFIQFIKIYIENGATAKAIQERSVILSKFFSTGIVNKAKVMNCESTVWEICMRAWTELFKAECVCHSFLNISLDETVFDLPPCNKRHELENIIFIKTNGYKISLERIAEVIMINDKMFILNAVVQQTNRGNKLHFFADIKRGNLSWYRFDNTIKGISKSKPNQKEISVHMLCYVRASKAEIDYHTDIDNQISKSFSIIQNFHTINYNGTKVIVKNACGPDSLWHIFCHIYVNFPKAIESIKSSDLLLDLANAYKRKDAQMVYKLRIKLLMQNGFKCTYSANEVILDAHSNVEACARMIFTNNFYSGIATRSCKCGETSRKLLLVEIDMQKLKQYGIEKLDSCFAYTKPKSICNVCRNRVKTDTQYSSLVFIDIQPMQSYDGIIELPAHHLNEFPHKIKINSNMYILRGIIEYIPGDVAHFTAHCSKFGIFHEYNDLFSDVRPSVDRKVIAFMLVYTRI